MHWDTPGQLPSANSSIRLKILGELLDEDLGLVVEDVHEVLEDVVVKRGREQLPSRSPLFWATK